MGSLSKVIFSSPGRMLLVSFLFVIMIGTILLSLPIARLEDISFIDTLFTATSATCVTGLKMVPMSNFSLFGQTIIILLVQLGGLGLMTLSIFFISLVLKLNLTTKIVAGKILDFESAGKIKKFLKLIVIFTFMAELLGATGLYFFLKRYDLPGGTLFNSIFLSISSFCNAGITLFETGISKFHLNTWPLFIMSILVFLGGIGFIVWYELVNNIYSKIKAKFNNQKVNIRYSLNTKIVLISSSILTILGFIAFFISEHYNTLKNVSLWHQFVNSLFLSISTRTAGFDTVDIAEMGLPMLLIIMILMFIGASSSSMGGGIKVSTFTVSLATVISVVKNKNYTEIFGRSIPYDQVLKAFTIIVLSVSWIGFTTFILLLTDPDFTFIQIFFEAVAAFSTTGFSTGITPLLSIYGKIILIVTMLLGRLGALTLVLALKRKQETHLYKYPEERILLG